MPGPLRRPNQGTARSDNIDAAALADAVRELDESLAQLDAAFDAIAAVQQRIKNAVGLLVELAAPRSHQQPLVLDLSWARRLKQ